MTDQPDYRIYLEEKFKGVNDKLELIHLQTLNTNGRVDEVETRTVLLEKADISHIINCPQAQKVKELEINYVQNKATKGFVYRAIGILFGLIGAIWMLASFLL